MKIVISTAVYPPMINGVAVFSRNLAQGLVKNGHKVLVICPSLTGKNQVKTEDGVKVARLKSIKIPFYPDQVNPVPPKKRLFGRELPRLVYKNGFRVSVFPQNEIKKLFESFRPDVVHCQISDPIGLSVVHYAKKNRIPVVTTEHNEPDVITDPLKLPKPLKKPVDALLSAYFKNRQKHSDFVTMPTQKSIENLLKNDDEHFSLIKNLSDFRAQPNSVEFFAKTPIMAVSNGVDLSSFTPGKPSKEFYQKYHLPEKRPVVLYIGRLDPEKQVGLALQAFKNALEKIPDAVFVIVGDGVDRNNLKSLSEKLELYTLDLAAKGSTQTLAVEIPTKTSPEEPKLKNPAKAQVIFAGRVLPPDLYDFYKLGDVFITASEIETQGIVLIEAAATGLPLVAVDAGAVSEIVKTDKNGYLCEPKNVDELAAALEKILLDKTLRQKFSQNSLKLAQPHDLQNTIKKFEQIYQTLIKSH